MDYAIHQETVNVYKDSVNGVVVRCDLVSFDSCPCGPLGTDKPFQIHLDLASVPSAVPIGSPTLYTSSLVMYQFHFLDISYFILYRL